MARVCRSLHVRLEDRDDSTTNALGYNGPDTKGGRGVPRDQVDGTDMESPREDHGPQIGNNCVHNSLHGCLKHRGMGTAVIEAKLAQQLAHLEQVPFYRVFIDLRKAFNAMDQY